jgi:hypothetical protein
MSMFYTINGNAGAPITGDTEAFSLFKLSLYNGALLRVGEARLTTLTDNLESRHLLDDVWDGGAVLTCLEQGQWFFARRTSQLDYDATITPNFGYQCAFAKPGDWVRTMAVCQDDRFNVPLTQYSDEAGYLFADMQTIWFAYVSSDPGYGGNLGLWPMSFIEAVQGYMAGQIVRKLCAGDESKIGRVIKAAERDMATARSRAAQAEGTKFPPVGAWVRARRGNLAGFDRGNTNSLYG